MEISAALYNHSPLKGGLDNRTKNELIAFTIVQTILLIVRLLTLVFFTV